MLVLADPSLLETFLLQRRCSHFLHQYLVLDGPAVEYRTAVFVPLLPILVLLLNAETTTCEERGGGFVFPNSVVFCSSVSSSVSRHTLSSIILSLA